MTSEKGAAENESDVLESLDWAKGILVADYLTAAHTRIELHDMKGGPLGELKLPGIGSAPIPTRTRSP